MYLFYCFKPQTLYITSKKDNTTETSQRKQNKRFGSMSNSMMMSERTKLVNSIVVADMTVQYDGSFNSLFLDKTLFVPYNRNF